MWDPPPPDQINGVIQGYRINITELDTGTLSQIVVDGTDTVVGPLHPHYNYNFSIVAFTHVGHGPTTYVIVRTAEASMYTLTLTLHIQWDIQASWNLSWLAHTYQFYYITNPLYLSQHHPVLRSHSRLLLLTLPQSASPGAPLHWRTRMESSDTTR